MKKLLLIWLLCLAHSQSFAMFDWERIGGSTDTDFYVAPNTVRPLNEHIYWWGLTNHIKTRDEEPGDFSSAAWYFKATCETEELKLLRIYLWTEPMGQGENVQVPTEDVEWPAVTHPDVIKHFKQVCLTRDTLRIENGSRLSLPDITHLEWDWLGVSKSVDRAYYIAPETIQITDGNIIRSWQLLDFLRPSKEAGEFRSMSVRSEVNCGTRSYRYRYSILFSSSMGTGEAEHYDNSNSQWRTTSFEKENPNETMLVTTVCDFALSNRTENPIVFAPETTLR